MLILLPPLAFVGLFIALLGRSAQREEPGPWQMDFLLASALWGAYLILLTEGLGLFTAIGRPGVALGWLAALVGVLAWGRREGYLAGGGLRLSSLVAGLSNFEIALLVFVGAMALVLLAVVFAAPVNTVDVLQYHMPRVLQWDQNGSLAHFPVPSGGQNHRPYWAEGVMLHLRLLWGGDAPVELVNWFAWLALAVAAAGSVRRLGGGRRKAWLAAVLSWTLPTAILHATTGMVDLPAAYWAAALGYFVLQSVRGGEGWGNSLGLGLSLGLGMLTKGTFFPVGATLMTFWGLSLLLRRRWRQLLVATVVIPALAASLNSGLWARNIVTYGGPYGSSLPVLGRLDSLWQGSALPGGQATNELETSSPGSSLVANASAGVKLGAPVPGGRRAPSTGSKDEIADQFQKMMRMGALHFVTPIGAVNGFVFRWMEGQPAVFPPRYREALRIAAWNNVMNGGSPIHWTLGAMALMIALARAIRQRDLEATTSIAYGLAVAGGFVLLSFVRFSDSIHATRYQLPILASMIPLVVAALPVRSPGLGSLVVAGLLLYSLPYVIWNQTRPAIGRTPWPTKIESVIVEDDRTILFAQSPEIADEYVLIANTVRRSGCRQVGFATTGKDLEYSLWWLLGAPSNGLRVGHLAYPENLEGLRDQRFQPCAVVCTRCDDEKWQFELPLELDGGHIQLFMAK